MTLHVSYHRCRFLSLNKNLSLSLQIKEKQSPCFYHPPPTSFAPFYFAFYHSSSAVCLSCDTRSRARAIRQRNPIFLQEKPYVMVKEDKNLTGNARFEGFCIDLLKWIAGQVGFQYAIRLVPDHMYGVYDPKTKEWNGIVRELMEKVKWETLHVSVDRRTRGGNLFFFFFLFTLLAILCWH